MKDYSIGRALAIFACICPSLVCFGLSAYCLVNHLQDGWFWFLFVGFITLEIPKRLISGDDESEKSEIESLDPKPSSVQFSEL